MTAARPLLLTLQSTFADRHLRWGLDAIADVKVSPTMHDLYMQDLPSAWRDPEARERLLVIGPNDYFHKWRGDEFAVLADSPLGDLLDGVDPRFAAAAVLDGKVTALPLMGGNHQLLFINRRFTDAIPATFAELMAETWRLRNGNALLWPFVYPTNACYFVLPLLYGFGAPLWSDPARPDDGITFESLRATLALHRQLMYEQVILPVKWEQYHSVFEFQTRRAAFCFGGQWDLSSHREALGDDLVAAPIPALDRPCRSTASCQYLYLSSALRPDLVGPARQVAELLLGDAVQRDIAAALHRRPARRGLALGAIAGEAGADADADADANWRCSRAVFESAVMLPPHRLLSHVYHVLGDLFEPGVLVMHPVEELAARAIRKMQDLTSTEALR